MARTLHEVLNESNLNKIADAGNVLQIGNALANIRTAKVTVASNVATLPDGAKCLAVLGGFRTAGTATGAISGVGPGATLAAGQAQPNAAGNIAFFGVDAVTAAEVTYLAYEGQVITRTVELAAGVHTIGGGGGRLLISAAVGGVAQTILARGDTTPSAGEARLSLDGSQILFPVAVTDATVTFMPFPTTTVDAALRSSVDF